MADADICARTSRRETGSDGLGRYRGAAANGASCLGRFFVVFVLRFVDSEPESEEIAWGSLESVPRVEFRDWLEAERSLVSALSVPSTTAV